MAVWSTAPPSAKKAKKAQAAVASLSLEDPAVLLDTALAGQGGSFHVAAVSDAGEAYVWECAQEDEEDGAVTATLLARLRVGSAAPTKG